ncbi:hypothetical protein BGW36DRAFT_159837 [Talaromyces proteolyticus]|uniref:CUE domain-containing protein n=1 Tax=Talaromyces proteolyticus TaxID=1131652 RepID=A0AAD4KQE5_9EURO|nr:uncharacterized protein BGW36DRAFT_159837 [Talaromyces proteolyticus]KAH8697031.1 hypothetical protein BGW36DRAFT_159837 [Talaromyces proteolyticus]
MADSNSNNTPTKSSAGGNNQNPESPTTARPLDFDDEPQETGVVSTPSKATPSKPAAEGDAPPPKPPRPISPRQQAEDTLKEAFPSIDATVVKAVLIASGYNVERAFHALLGMTDPNAQEELPPPPPVKPPRPTHTATSTTQQQLQDDERYARQLAEHYGSARPRDPAWDAPSGNYPEEREHSFFDDDLPVIRDNIRKGFLETQSKVNSWVQNFKKKLDGEEEDDHPTSEGYLQSYGETQTYGRSRRSGDSGRRSGDRERYDADPQVLGDDFSALELRDAEAPPPRPARPLANPNLFKSSSQERRKVSFQDGPPEEIDNIYDSQEPTKRTASTGGKSSKWQPLSTVDPSPVGENDPFSLGDSEDEKDTKPKDTQTDESDRVKKATADAMAEDLGTNSKDEDKKEKAEEK